MRFCNFPNGKAGDLCERCGRELPRDLFHNEVYRQQCAGTPAERKKLGDKVEALFASIGITQDKYKEVKEKFGWPPTCDCPKRKEWLNRVDDWLHGRSGQQ